MGNLERKSVRHSGSHRRDPGIWRLNSCIGVTDNYPDTEGIRLCASRAQFPAFSHAEYAQKTIKNDMKTIKEIREKAGLRQRECSVFPGMNTEGSVADRLKLARKSREYTQGELASLVSCS